MDEFEFREVDEKLRGSYVRSQIQRMQKRFLPQGHMEEFVSDDRLFQIEAKIIRELVKAEKAVLLSENAADLSVEGL